MEIRPEVYKLLEAIDAVYFGGLPRDLEDQISYEKAREHTWGDSLADHIVIEAVEGTEGYEGLANISSRLYNLLCSSIQDLQVVVNTLIEMED